MNQLIRCVKTGFHQRTASPGQLYGLLKADHSVDVLRHLSSAPSEGSSNEDEGNPLDGIKFKDPNKLVLPRSLLKSSDNLIVKAESAPDIFGNLSSDDGTPSEVYEVDEEDRREEEFLAKVPQKLPQRKYVEMIKKLLDERRFADALDVLQVRMLKEDRVKPEYYIYGYLISFCGKVGYTKMAFKLYNDMKKRALKVTPSIYTSLFNACSNSPWPEDGLQRARHLMQLMEQKGVQPSEIICNVMIKAFGRCGDLETAFSIADRMMDQKMALRPDTFSFILQSCINDKEAGFRHSLLVFRKMLQYGINPQVFQFNLLLRSVRDNGMGDIESMEDVLKQMGVKGIKGIEQLRPKSVENPSSSVSTTNSPGTSFAHPWEDEIPKDIVSGGHFVETPENHGSSEVSETPELIVSTKGVSQELLPNLLTKSPTLGCIVSLSELSEPEHRFILLGGINGFLNTMSDYNVAPNYKTAALLLECIPQTCSAEKSLYKLMKKLKVSLTVTFFNIMIRRRCLRKEYQEARDVLSLIAAEGESANLITFGCLAMTCRNVREAIQLVETLKAAGLRPNIEIVTALMRVAAFKCSYNYIQYIFQLIKEEEISVTEKFMNHMNTFYSECQRRIEIGASSTCPEYVVHSMTKFCKEWPKIKKNLQMEEDVHPWKQLRERLPEPSDTDRAFLEDFVSKEKLRSNFPSMSRDNRIRVSIDKKRKAKPEKPVDERNPLLEKISQTGGIDVALLQKLQQSKVE